MPQDPMSIFRLDAARPREIRDLFADPTLLEFATDTARQFDQKQFKPLPAPTGTPPFRLNFGEIVGPDLIEQIVQQGKLVFHAVGDTGEHGHGAEAQESVSFHMERQIKSSNVANADKPVMFYHLGDVVYYNGELNLYPEQFYDPYQFYPAPILAIAGNHDADNVPEDQSLSAFMDNFCTRNAHIPPMPGQSRRLTMTQPNVYFTLNLPFATLIGLYSNNTGDLDDPKGDATPQLDWFTEELRAADPAKFLIVAVHHPPFSLDDTHGGERNVGLALDAAFERARRLPHLVLAAHVHDYQRLSRRQSVAETSRTVPYIIAGAGGYAGYQGLHQVYPNVPLPDDVKLIAYNDVLPGFLRLTITSTILQCDYFVVPSPPLHLSESYPAMLVDTITVAF